MFGMFSSKCVQFFIRRKWLFLLVLISISAVLINGIRRITIEEDIYSVFPKGAEYKQFSEILKHNNLNKQIVFSINANKDVDRNFEILDSLSEVLATTFKSDINTIEVYRTIDEAALVSYLQSAAIPFLNSKDYQEIEKRLKNESIDASIAEVATKLSGASSIFAGQFYAKDPLGLLNARVGELAVEQNDSTYQVEDGIIYSSNKTKIVFFANVSGDLQNTDKLVALNDKLSEFKNEINQSNSDLKFDFFGTFQIAAENAVQVKKDTFITLLISLGLIVLLLVVYYRSVLVPVYFIFPAIFGILSGVGMVGYFHPTISAISLATAGILLGIVLDYAFHFFTHLKHSGSIIETVKEISAPMLIGSFTTVAAFAALLFTDSIVLQNFGLIALFTLMGAALFTIFFLPVLIHLLKIKLPPSKHVSKEKTANKLLVRLALFSIVGVTFFLIFKGTSMNFDADLNHLSYHPEALKEKEKEFTGIHPASQKKIYVFSNASTKEEAKRINFELFQKINPQKEGLKISEFISVAPYEIPEETIIESTEKWVQFWENHPNISTEIQTSATNYNFSSTAFQPFLELLKNPSQELENNSTIINDLGLSKLYYSDSNKHSYLTSIVVERSHLDACKAEINSIEGAYILDLTTVAENMLSTVQEDFNFLLIFSSLLVFLSLLIVYGRIELALFAFFPMVLAWIWILGIAELFSIEFNFVNIIIATFIFGLGDDFSIFITDGLIQKYKANKDAISSYKSAIILSGVTTIIGTGALYFAKHPAIHSIAIISVVGILTIMLITLYVQPKLFDWFVTRRIKKGRGPITFFTFILSGVLFAYFFLGSIILTVFLIVILVPFPARRSSKKKLLNYLVSKLAKSTLYAGFHVKKIVINSEQLDYSRPSIIIANHTSFLDILAVLMLHPKTIIMVKKWVYNSPVFGLFIRYSGYIFAEEGAEGNLDEIKKRFENGYSLVIFPEGTRSVDGEIKRFHKGAFLLSQELNVDIQPILLIGVHEVNPKNDVMIHRGTIIVKPLNRLKSLKGESYTSFSKRVLSYMRTEYSQARKEYAKSKFWYPSIIQNYVLKGPVLEWYVRVKYALERKNFEFYDEIIDERSTIYDIGCGYGYLSYYLHYRNKNRTILGLDYDEEKIDTAQNALKKNTNLQFQCADLRTVQFENADAVLLNDVLHYLPNEDQFKVLNDICNQLNENGVVFIRDGVVELKDRIKNTRITEVLSTKLFKFNKVVNELEFLSIEKLKAFAEEKHLSFELIEHSKTTANVLIILRKNGQHS